MAERDAQYTFDVTEDDLTNISTETRSVLVDQLDRIKAAAEVHGKFVKIASYGKPAAAASASKSLRHRFGDSPAQAGWLFRHKRDDDGRYGLYARFSPGEIVEGELAKWLAQEKAKAARKAAEKATKAEAKGPQKAPAQAPPAQKAS